MKYFKVYVGLAIVLAVLGIICFCLGSVLMGIISILACALLGYLAYGMHKEIIRKAEAEAEEIKKEEERKREKEETQRRNVELLASCKVHITEVEQLLLASPEDYDLLTKKRNYQITINELEGDSTYVPLPGFEVVDYKKTRTYVRNAEGYLDDDEYDLLEIDDFIEVNHAPCSGCQERVEFTCGDTILGEMKSDMASDYIKQYGEYFSFYGHLVEKNKKLNYLDEPHYSLAVELEVPVVCRIKQK